MHNVTTILLRIYTLLIALGGFMGYRASHSKKSLLFALAAAGLLTLSMQKKWLGAFYSALASFSLILLLALFFARRFLLTGKWMPGGMFALLSLAMLIVLLVQMPRHLVKLKN